jgi:hypothetical protein
LAIKRADPSADVSGLEKEIDQFVCALYGLSPRETELIEGASAKTHNKG